VELSSKFGSEYVLLTAAYNEEEFIGKTIESVISQTVRPKSWIIVSDGSTDRTDSIVQGYSDKHSFIKLYRITEQHARNFAAQVNAINKGYDLVRDLDFEFIGNVDADVSFEATYYERLLGKFVKNQNLGIAGGYIHEEKNGIFRSRTGNSERSVAHAVQLFRRACFLSVGGYVALPYGGPDWLAEIMARKQGWEVESFPELPVRHYRPTCSAGGVLKGRFRQGLMDYSLGCDPSFEFFKCLSRLHGRPYIAGAVARFSGFVWAWCKRHERAVPQDIVNFLREEQKGRVRSLLHLNPTPRRSTPSSL